jgi:uncharacterized tellurite resistance protein B-like protein
MTDHALGVAVEDANDAKNQARLAELDCVIADPLKFKRKLRIGEDAYAVLRATKGARDIWDAGGVAATGAGLAASQAVAGTFFSGGLLGALGIGVATPIGWVLAAAALSGGVYYGVGRLARRQHSRFVDTIPRFINTAIDTLGMELLDLIGALALRVASIDGYVAPEEREVIYRHFADDWGYDPAYVVAAIDILEATAEGIRVKAVAQALAQFQAASPDCNAEAMQDELLAFLREIMEADGRLDERQELAIDAIAETFRKERAVTLTKIGQAVTGASVTAGAAVGRAVTGAGVTAGAAVGKLVKGVGRKKEADPRGPI